MRHTRHERGGDCGSHEQFLQNSHDFLPGV
jgi:hypothetical protein